MTSAPPCPPCWICGEPGRRPRFSLRGETLLSCPGCGLVHRWPLPSPDGRLKEVRTRENVPSEYAQKQLESKKPLRRWQLRRIQELSPAGKILDVGCGFGFFLQEARQAGWEVQGIEVSPPEQRYAAGTLALPVQDKPLEEAGLPDDSFDVVTLWEVAEVVADPWKMFSEAFRVLKPGGWLWLRANNARFHLPALWWEQRPPLSWLGLRPGIFHLYGFSPASLEQALRRKGFQNTSSLPSPATAGDPYGQGGLLGPLAVRAGKFAATALSQILYGPTGQVLSPAFVTRAQKPRRNPLIVHLITRLESGGSAENVVYSAQKVSPARYDSLLMAGPSARPTPLLRNAHLPIPELRREIRPWEDFKTLLSLRRRFKALAPRIVHTHTSKAGVLGRWAAFFARVPCIVHTPHGHVFYGYFGPLKSRFYAWLEKITARITHRLAALTDGEREESLAWGVGHRDQWRVVHSGVAWDETAVRDREALRRSVRERWGMPPQSLVVGTVCRLEPVKGAKHLAEAARLLLSGPSLSEKPLYFLFVGDGAERPAVEKIRASLPSPARLILAGHQTDVLPFMAAMDVYAQPSLNEGMGKTLIQAQALGLPIVASRVGGVPDAAPENVSALLVPPADPTALAGAIEKLLKDPALARQMGERGRAWVAEPVEGHPRFSVERMVFLLEKLYDELLYGKS